jgi:hypothetical protein
MEKVARACFVLGFAALVFGYGYLVRSWKLPPYSEIKQASDALQAVALYLTDTDYLTFDTAHASGGATIADEAAVAPGLTFVSRYDGQQFAAELVDLDGRVVHRWQKLFHEVWGDNPTHLQFAADDRYI